MQSFRLDLDATTDAPTGTHRSADSPAVLEVDTPHGSARVHVHGIEQPRGWLVLGHGAGGGVTSRDLEAAAEAAQEARLGVALVEQPYRVAGRRNAAPADQLDASWLGVVNALRTGTFGGAPLVAGGRSSGARVACRTAEAAGAVAVLCLAFPLAPPRRAGGKPPVSRLPELDAGRVPSLVVQGERDPFGIPPASAARTVLVVSGDHSLRSDLPAVRAAVHDWLYLVVP